MPKKRNRKKATKNKGPKGALKALAKDDGKLGNKDIQYLAQNYPEIKASDIRSYLKKPENSKVKGPKSNIRETLRSTRPSGSQPSGKRSDLTDGKGIKGAIKILAEDGRLGNKDIAFLAEKYPELKASDIRRFLERDKNSDVKRPKDNIKETIRSTRGEEVNPPGGNDPPEGDNTPEGDTIPEGTDPPKGEDPETGTGPKPVPGGGNPNVPGDYVPYDPTTIEKSDYPHLRTDLQTRGKFYEALYSGQGGKETTDVSSFDISKKEAKTFLKQLELDATQRMQINPKKYGRTKGKKIYETIKMPDGSEVKQFTGEYEADLSKIARFSNAEKYDAGGDTRRQMFKDLRSNFTTERDRQKERLANSNDPTRFLTVFGQGDKAAFDEDRLKQFMDTGSAQREKIRGAAKRLGVKSLGESNTDAINRLSKSITDNATVDSFADLRSDFMTKKQNIRSTLKS